jgi:hypothetical protein
MDDVVVTYNSMEHGEARDDYYIRNIDTQLQCLIESVVNGMATISDYICIEEGRENVITDCKSFVVSKFSAYQKEKGKSYSLFTVIAKHYLIQLNKKAYQRRQREDNIDVAYDDDFELINKELLTLSVPPDRHKELQERVEEMVTYWKDKGHIYFNSSAIRKVFDAWMTYVDSGNLGDHNTTEYFREIRKLTGKASPTTLRKSLKIIKYVNQELIKHYNEFGELTTAPIYSASFYMNK